MRKTTGLTATRALSFSNISGVTLRLRFVIYLTAHAQNNWIYVDARSELLQHLWGDFEIAFRNLFNCACAKQLDLRQHAL
jgi:hypothetical protein